METYLECWRTCSSCKGLMPNDCLSCVGNHFIAPDNSCACLPKFYDLDRLDNCMELFNPCHKHCNTCVGGEMNQCVQCNQNRSLFLGSCPCAKGYFNNHNDECNGIKNENIFRSPYLISMSF
jgi:hypothetical protein